MNKHYENTKTYDDIQLAENIEVEDKDSSKQNYSLKRKELEKTKISKQTWSVRELYQKMNSNILNLEPEYQRDVIWQHDKQIAFIESLLMGIVVPPLYFVEIPGNGPLEPTKYEVVDGKQRLYSIKLFLNSDLKLRERYLEYYGDIYSEKNFQELSEEYDEEMDDFASQTLDIYVITASSPESTKYDIFSRLNKGSAALRVNEIRKAVYHSELIKYIEKYIEEKRKNDKERYTRLFSKNKMLRYEDYGIFYKAVTFYLKINEKEREVEEYNSRPRELINKVLSNFQKNKIAVTQYNIDDIPLEKILDSTMEILEFFDNNNANSNAQYYLECCIKIAVDSPTTFDSIKESIKNDEAILETFIKSKATTSNVNKRIGRVYSLRDEFDEK